MEALWTRYLPIYKIVKTWLDEMLAVNLQYDDGAISQFSYNLLSKNENSFMKYGSKGHIKIHDNFWAAIKASRNLNDKEMTIRKPVKASGFEYQIEEATSCIINKDFESSIMPHCQFLANMELMDSIRKKIGLKYSFE